jgi:hypothetical protein
MSPPPEQTASRRFVVAEDRWNVLTVWRWLLRLAGSSRQCRRDSGDSNFPIEPRNKIASTIRNGRCIGNFLISTHLHGSKTQEIRETKILVTKPSTTADYRALLPSL